MEKEIERKLRELIKGLRESKVLPYLEAEELADLVLDNQEVIKKLNIDKICDEEWPGNNKMKFIIKRYASIPLS